MNQINKEYKEVYIKEMKLTEAEAKIIEDIRRVKYGKVEVYISDGKPYRKDLVEQRRIVPEEGGSAGVYPKKQTGVEL